MADNTNTASEANADQANATESETAERTVISHMPSRSLFDSTDDALAFLSRMSTECVDFGDESIAKLTVGLTDEGEFDPEVYNDSMYVTVARLTKKGSKAEGTESRAIAIVVYPTPKLDAVAADEAGAKWLESLVEKEANLIAMRALRRDEGTMADNVASMPRTLADYWTPSTTGGSSLLASYNELWQAIRDATGTKIPALKQAGLSKKVFRQCLESASYADELYPRLETRKSKSGQEYSAFVYALHIGLTLAKEEGLDPAFFEQALAERDDKVIAIADSGEDDVDLDFLTDDEADENGE